MSKWVWAALVLGTVGVIAGGILVRRNPAPEPPVIPPVPEQWKTGELTVEWKKDMFSYYPREKTGDIEIDLFGGEVVVHGETYDNLKLEYIHSEPDFIKIKLGYDVELMIFLVDKKDGNAVACEACSDFNLLPKQLLTLMNGKTFQYSSRAPNYYIFKQPVYIPDKSGWATEPRRSQDLLVQLEDYIAIEASGKLEKETHDWGIHTESTLKLKPSEKTANCVDGEDYFLASVVVCFEKKFFHIFASGQLVIVMYDMDESQGTAFSDKLLSKISFWDLIGVEEGATTFSVIINDKVESIFMQPLFVSKRKISQADLHRLTHLSSK